MLEVESPPPDQRNQICTRNVCLPKNAKFNFPSCDFNEEAGKREGEIRTVNFGHYVLIIVISANGKKGKLISNIKTIFFSKRVIAYNGLHRGETF